MKTAHYRIQNSRNMAKHLYGIDFGTSNSAISIFDADRGEIINTIVVPSILYFSNTQASNQPLNYFVGKEAVAEYIKEGMKGRFMKSIKRILPRKSFSDTRVFSKKMTAPDLVTLVLQELKKRADQVIGYSCTKAVIGRPVFFDDDDTEKDALAQTRLLKAAEQAGFTDIRFQYEPIAAAYAYERNIIRKEKVLVADLGGGTTDFTFINLDPAIEKSADRRKDIYATGGVYVGGDSFDSSFMFEKGTPHFGRGDLYQSAPGKYLDLPLSLFTNICSWEKMNFFNSWKVRNDIEKYYVLTGKNDKLKNLETLVAHNLGYQLFQAVEKTKIELSSLPASVFQFSTMGIDINDEVGITNYNQVIRKDLDKIETYLDRFLHENNIHAEAVDTIFLTGGTSLVSAVQELFKRKFPQSKIETGDHFISVVKGLAYSGYLFENPM
jgi:hypothetical chaperone protein